MLEEEKKIYEFYVAGIQHHQLHTCINEIKVGDELFLELDPTNSHDPNAVKILFEKNKDKDQYIMLGFVPKAKGDYSTKVTALIDLKPIKCIVTAINPQAKTYEQLKVAIVEDDEWVEIDDDDSDSSYIGKELEDEIA